MRCKLLWPTYSAATACKGRSNGRCRDGWNDARRGRVWRADGTRGGAGRAARGAGAGARGRLVCRGGRNAFTSYTNYFPPHYCNSLALARSLARTHARTHALRTTVAPIVHPSGCTHSPGHRFSFLFYCHRIVQRYACTRMNNTSLIESLNTELQSAHAEMLAIRSAGIFGKARLAACKRVIVALEALNAAQKAGK